LNWTTTTSMKFGFWAIANVDSAIKIVPMDFAGGSVSLTTAWKVKSTLDLTAYFDAFSVDGGGAGHLPNVGASSAASGLTGGIGGTFGNRRGDFGGPNETDNLVEGGPSSGALGYQDGGGNAKGIASAISTNDGVTFSWAAGEPGYDTNNFAILVLGGLGWTTTGQSKLEGELGATYPSGFYMAGGLSDSSGRVDFPNIYSNPSFPYPGFPSEKRGDHGSGKWVGFGAWDLASNQWIGIAGGRAYNSAHSDGIFHSDSPSWHGWFDDRIAFALNDYDVMPWYRTLAITDNQHGITTDHGTKPPATSSDATGANSSHLVFGTLFAPLLEAIFKQQIIRYR